MKPIRIDTDPGFDFKKVAKNAKTYAAQNRCLVEFEFNGKICKVGSVTNLDNLFRDFQNSRHTGWETIGPACYPEYPPSVQKEVEDARAESERKQQKQQAEWDAETAREKAAFALLVGDVEPDFDADKFAVWKKNNADPYGAAVVDYATDWAKLMQVKMAAGETLENCAGPTSFELGFHGITGFMYGAAVSILSNCWKHGDALRVWHNAEYNHEGDGVANPALLTISG